MMPKRVFNLVILICVAIATQAFGQGDPRKGDPTFRKKGNHNGNKVNSIFYNYGLVGDLPPEISGEWPIGTGNEYVGDVSPLVGVEYPVAPGDTIISVVTSSTPRGWDDGPAGGGEFWGFEPLPGYTDASQGFVATSGALDSDGPDHIPGSADDDGKPDSWPNYWPDHPDWVDADGITQWNGFFGRGVMNADLESYFRFDDSRDAEFLIFPDPADQDRRGLGYEVKARGLQWAHFLAEDCIFWLYEIINEGTLNYDKASFGMIVGTLAGGRSDSRDDLAFFDLANDITYSWDADDRGSPGWVPVSSTRNVGYVGYAYLESPGIDRDGIDNDGDADSLSVAPRFTEADFAPRRIQAGMEIISIHPVTFERTIVAVPNQPFTFTTQGMTYNIIPGQTVVEELETDVIDNDFDGLINESYEAHYNQLVNPPDGYDLEPRPALRHIDYVSGAGSQDLMIDEGRFDGVDNDGDWNPVRDDLGADGAPHTGDPGEGDGLPTAGEPHFDQTDVDESDQIGLTTFDYFSPPGQIRLSNDPQVWGRMTPGVFDVIPGQAEDGDFIYASGYFPTPAKSTQFFSFSLVYGEDFDDILNNKITVQTIYDENYNFARPPAKPNVRAFAGDRYVTLYWDSASENSYDPTSGYDFEGYKIYRATDPAFNEINTITDGFGRKIFYEPIAVFDIFNEYKGFFPVDYQGVQYYLGKNNGLRHAFTDSSVTNGITYYYAVTAYDHGEADKSIFPAETTKSILKAPSGNISLDINTVVVRPNAPVNGYLASGTDDFAHVQGSASGEITLAILDPSIVPDMRTYEIRFTDNGYFERNTSGYRLIDVTNSSPDTILKFIGNPQGDSDMFGGMRLNFQNRPSGVINESASGWNHPEKNLPAFTPSTIERCTFVGHRAAFSYEISMTSAFEVRSESIFVACFPRNLSVPPKPANFRVRNTSLNQDVKFGYSDLDGIAGLSKGDEIFFLEYNEDTRRTEPTWYIKMSGSGTTDNPAAGDILKIIAYTPFNRNDVYRFTTHGATADAEGLTETDLKQIKVVPNPYIASATWEQDNPYQTGRGERRIDFTHVPKDATIRIYTIRGELVQTLQHAGSIFDGTVSWDLRTKDGLNAAYGMYIYHVEAPGIGERIDKFAVIK